MISKLREEKNDLRKNSKSDNLMSIFLFEITSIIYFLLKKKAGITEIDFAIPLNNSP